jgi:hypothetical protein
MPVEVEPPELAQLLDYAERPRADGWSLRAALVRYAQPEPERVGRILELVRRTDAALGKHSDRLEREGPAIWADLTEAPHSPQTSDELIGLLQAAAELDRFGEGVARWAVDRVGDRPDIEADEVIVDIERRLDTLGVPREERAGRPPRSR